MEGGAGQGGEEKEMTFGRRRKGPRKRDEGPRGREKGSVRKRPNGLAQRR